MKVGIVTFYYKNYNFGGALQARALTLALQTIKNVQAEQIQVDFNKQWENMSALQHIRAVLKHHGLLKTFQLTVGAINKRKTEASTSSDRLQAGKRIRSFDKFSQETPHSEKVYATDDIKECEHCYDVYICGGDQIWNDWGTGFYSCALDIYTLNDIPDNFIKFSYAPSIPLKKPNKAFLKKLKSGISRLDAVSVREKSSVKLIEDMTTHKVEVVVDPVLLLTREQWDMQCVLPKIKEKYILCYFLGTGGDKRQAAQEYANRLGVSLLTFPYIGGEVKDDDAFGNLRDFTSGPAEFIGLIQRAEVVITDSFHASVMSMIYHKPFFTMERNTCVGGGSMESRLTDFLKEYGLIKQKVTVEQLRDFQAVPIIDYAEADKTWNQRRLESFSYLERNLQKIK